MEILNKDEISELKELTMSNLTQAKKIWSGVGHEMKNFALGKIASRADSFVCNESVESQIPDYEFIDPNKPLVDDFIAIVADMRDSTEHLRKRMQENDDSGYTPLQRAFYETYILLPSLSHAINIQGGKVTEYLGDGVLGFFRASEDLVPNCIYSAYMAAKACLETVQLVINPILKDECKLPPISIGIGLAKSKAIIYVTGTDEHYEGKLFGECVYYATKLSGEKDKIVIDECLESFWPRTSEGTLVFNKIEGKGGIEGYCIGN